MICMDILNKLDVSTSDLLNLKLNTNYTPEKPAVPIPYLFGLIEETKETDKNILQNEITEIKEPELEYGVAKLYNYKSKKDIILKNEDEIKKYLEDNIVNGIIIKKNAYMKPYFKINILFNKNEKECKMQNSTSTTAGECIEFIKKNFCANDKTDIRTLRRNKRTINKDGIEMELFEYYFIIQDYISTPTDICGIFCKIYKGVDKDGFVFSKTENKKNVKILKYFDTSIYDNDAVIDVINSILPKKEDVDVLYEYGKLEKTSLNNILSQYIPTFILKDFNILIDTKEESKTDEEINADMVEQKSITIREYYDDRAVLYLDKNKHLVINEFNKCKDENPRDHDYDIEVYFEKLVDSLFILDKENGEIRNYNYKDVLYKPTSDNLNGRLYSVGKAYINMPRFLRHTLAKDLYVDFDIVNCYYVLLLNICIQNDFEPSQYSYIKDFVTNRKKYFDTFKNKSRDKIKVVFNCILMYGEFKDEGLADMVRKLNEQVNNMRDLIVELPKYEDYKNIVANKEKGDENTNCKILSRILQQHELEIIKCVMEYLKNEGFTIGSYCYDGLLIEKDDKLTDSILPKIKQYTFDKCAFDVDFVFKDMNEGLILPSDYIYTPDKYVDVIDEVDACERFVKDNKHRLNGIKNDKGSIDRYYKNNNIWIGGGKEKVFTDEIADELMKLKYYKRIRAFDGSYYYGDRFLNGGTIITSVSKLISKKTEYVTDDFKTKLFASTLGKICLNDGVYYFKEKSFKKYPVEDVYSVVKINYNLPPRNEADIKKLIDNMLLPIFKGDYEHLISSIQRISRAIAGHIEDKNFLFNIGLRHSGKGTLEKLIKVSFGDYISTTNGNNFITKNINSGDVAKSLSWLLPFRYKRLIIMNEIDADAKSTMNGILLKMVASGGDELEARANYIDEIQFQIQSTIMFNFNRPPAKIEPFDATETAIVIQNRAVFLSKSEITDENRSYAIEVNSNLKIEIRDEPRWRNAFFWFVIDNYKDTKPELTGTLLNDTEAFKASYRYDDDDDAIIRKYFQITNNKNDKVFSREIVNHKDKYDDAKYLNRKELFQKFRVWGAEFKKNIRIGSIITTGYTGLKLIEPEKGNNNSGFVDEDNEDDDEDEDENVVVNMPVMIPAKRKA